MKLLTDSDIETGGFGPDVDEALEVEDGGRFVTVGSLKNALKCRNVLFLLDGRVCLRKTQVRKLLWGQRNMTMLTNFQVTKVRKPEVCRFDMYVFNLIAFDNSR